MHRDALADDLLLQLVEGQLDRGPPLGGLRIVGVAPVGLEHLLLDGPGGLLALELVLHLGGGVELVVVGLLDGLENLRVHLGRLHLELGLARLLGQLALDLAQLADLPVGDVEGIQDLRLGDLVGPGLDHQDRVLSTSHDQVEV